MLDSAFFDNVRQFSQRVKSWKPSASDTDMYAFAELETASEELRAAEEELRAQSLQILAVHEQLDAERAKYRDLFDGAPDGYFVTDPNGKIVEANRAAAQMLNVRQEFIAGRPLLRFFVDDDQPLARREILQFHQTHRPTEWTSRVAPRGGSPSYWVSLRISAVTDVDEQLTAIRWIMRDVTAQKQLEARLRQLNDELEDRVAARTRELESADRQKDELLAQATAARTRLEQHIAANDQYLAVLSHELRTPLAPALAILTELAQRKNLPPDIRSAVTDAIHNLELEVRMVDDLLDTTRAAHGKLNLRIGIVDAHQLIDSVARICGHEFGGERGLRLLIKAHAASHHVPGDSARLHQVLWNLLRNAAKFSPPGGVVTIATAHTENELEISVQDDGSGIDPDRLESIFEPFAQATTSFGGLGIGLAVVKAVTLAHGGRVFAESAGQGRGARFVLRLPLADAHDATIPPPAATRPAPRLRILLVEDHVETRLVFTRLLKGMGHDVLSVATIRDAVRECKSTPFDLLLTDLQLPDGNGADILQQCGASRPRHAVVVSGFAGPDEEARSMAAGFHCHVTKPLSFLVLESLLRDAAAS